MRVFGNQWRSDKLTVRLISVVPWEVLGDQVVKKYSVMDLGQDSPVLCVQKVCVRRGGLCAGALMSWKCSGKEGRGGQSTIFAIKRSVPMSVKMQQTLEHKRIISSSDGPTKSHVWKSKSECIATRVVHVSFETQDGHQFI